MERPLNIAVLSDLHLGIKRNRIEEMIKALNAALPDNAETAKLDIIFLAGDVFDRLLELTNPAVSLIEQWIVRLFKLCSKHDIMLRVLEGTPSHDWKQSECFNTMQKVTGIPVDMKYVKTLSIEYIEEFDKHVLYVPDEWDASTDNTLLQVKELMYVKGISQVDIAIMHGLFEYQLKMVVKGIPKHSSEEYLKLVRDVIFIGHIHTYSNLDKIYAQGSFDRLSHGEEEPKGHIRATLFADGTRQVTFVENKLARKYITIKCGDLSIEDLIAKVTKIVNKIPDDSCVRLEGSSTHPAIVDMASIVRLYPTIVWSKHIKEDNEDTIIEEDVDDVQYIPISIDRDNVEGLLMKRVLLTEPTTEITQSVQRHLMELI